LAARGASRFALDATPQVRQECARMADLPAIAQRFIEDFALAVETSGMPRTAGRIIGLLIILDEGAGLEEIAERLKVSRAGASTNTRLLESLGAIERYSPVGSRRTQYRIADFRYARFTEAALARMRRIQSIAREARRQLPAAMTKAKRRLHDLDEYYEASIETAEAVLARLRSNAAARRRRSRPATRRVRRIS
jgi:DNA-binding transcriptional regulator GbsR (MarR family)